MKAKERKSVISTSNQRLVIMGLFNATGCASTPSNGITFSGMSGDDKPKLTVAEFFHHIAPELRYERDKTVKVGDTSFNSFKLRTPATAGSQGHGQVITQDSPFLSSEDGVHRGTDAERWQEAGGKLLQGLLLDLDEVARFADGRFSAALLKLARRYMIDYADSQMTDDKVDRAEWEALAYDHASASAILNYMTCYGADEPNARAEASKALVAHAEGPNSPLTQNRVEQLMAGLEQCRRVLEGGIEDDGVIQAISRDTNYRYLADYAGSKYGISVPGAGAKGFVAHYRYYRTRSDAVHRFVRNGSLHSYLFLWLAGKYTPFQSAEDFPVVSKVMFDLGVEGQGDKRIPGETAEERRRNFELVRDAESTVSESERATLKESNVYERLETILQEGILEKLQPERAFRRSTLNKRNRELFVALGQMAGGRAGQILNQATDRAEALSRVYRAVKNVRGKDGAILQKADFETALKRLRSPQMTAFVDKVMAQVDALSGEGDALKSSVCETVVRAIAVETKTYFDQSWLKDMDAIDEEVRMLGDIYDLRNRVDVERRADASRGMPMTVLTQEEISILAPVEASAEDRERYAKSIEKAAAASGAGAKKGPVSTELAVPVKLEATLKEASEGVIKDADGKTLVTVSAEPERGLLKATVAEGVKPEQLLSAANTVQMGDLGELKVVDLQGLDLQPLVAAVEEQGPAIDGIASSFGSYSETQRLIREKYAAERGEKGDTAFTRSVRALALGEYMAATPPNESNLGVADLSNVLGIALDIVEHIGEVSNPKMFSAGTTLPPDVLGRMNLSLHYPVNNAGELSRVLQYHYGQCESLGELSDYFKELRSIKSLFESLQGTEAEITVYNCKVADHAGKGRGQVRQARDLFLVKEHPVVAYFTAQAEPTGASIAALSQRVVATLRRRTEDTATLQLPVIVTPVEVDVSNSIFAVVSPSNVPLPSVVKGGTPAADEDDVLPCTKADLDSYLALAASLVVPAAGPELGLIDDIMDDQAITVEKQLHVTPEDKQPLTQLMREGWFAIGSELCTSLCATKWINVCLLHDQDKPEDEIGNLLSNNALLALKDAADPKAEGFLVPDLFYGLDTPTVKGSKEGFLSYMPHVFEGKNSAPLSGRTQKIGLAAGNLGVQNKSGGKAQNFGEVPFLAALATMLSSPGAGADADE